MITCFDEKEASPQSQEPSDSQLWDQFMLLLSEEVPQRSRLERSDSKEKTRDNAISRTVAQVGCEIV